VVAAASAQVPVEAAARTEPGKDAGRKVAGVEDVSVQAVFVGAAATQEPRQAGAMAERKEHRFGRE